MNDGNEQRRRVVVTGLGLVTPSAPASKSWEALVPGRSGVGPISRFDAAEFPTRIAGEVRDFAPGLHRGRDQEDGPVHPVRDGRGRHGDGPQAEDRRRQCGPRRCRSSASAWADCRASSNITGSISRAACGGVAVLRPEVIANLAPGQISISFGASGIELHADERMRLGGDRGRRGLPQHPSRLPGRGHLRRGRGGDLRARRRRVHRDARTLDPQRRARAREPSVRQEPRRLRRSARARAC